MKEFLWSVRVYYEDTDGGGVVYHTNYLKFLERTRTEMLRHAGFEQDRLIEEEGVIFVVRSLQVDYLKPARFNDMLQVSAVIRQVGRASLTFAQSVTRAADATVLCTADVRIACLDAGQLTPCPIPEAIRREFTDAD